jgi:mannose-6-phosphate isomerase-like protein (cupin superfamily)
MDAQAGGKAVVVKPGDGQPLPRIPLSIRVNGAESGGRLEVYESRRPDGPAAAPPPPHVHRTHEELFYILDGRFTFVLGHETTTVEAGSLIFVPRGTTHGFTPDPGARLLVVTIPAGLEGFFRELGEGLAAGRSNLEIRAALEGRFDSHLDPASGPTRSE